MHEMILKVFPSFTKATFYLFKLDIPYIGKSSSTTRSFAIRNRIFHNYLKDILIKQKGNVDW